jgi:hypothetical protein
MDDHSNSLDVAQQDTGTGLGILSSARGDVLAVCFFDVGAAILLRDFFGSGG